MKVRNQMTLKIALCALAALTVAHGSPALADDLPLNPDVTQATIVSTICQTGWTRTVRP